MIRISSHRSKVILESDDDKLSARHYSQLAFWGFIEGAVVNHFEGDASNAESLDKLLKYLKRHGLDYELDENIERIMQDRENAIRSLTAARDSGQALKEGRWDRDDIKAFVSFLREHIVRQLKSHQRKAALHLLTVRNGANFSVPGSGKTTVVLVAFHKLRLLGKVDSLFVVGPPACFGPWTTEYAAVLGREPKVERLAGGDIEHRRSKYWTNGESVADMYLTTFQTLQNDWEHVRILFQRQGIRFYFVVDEAHYMKQQDGVWANAVLNVAKYATYRCVLTGTPFPRSYVDAFNLFDATWPDTSPIPEDSRRRIQLFMQHNDLDQAAELLDSLVGPLFYRVRKRDLGLAEQVFHEPIVIKMNQYERLIYDSIVGRIMSLSESQYIRDAALLARIKKGRMMRLRQALSYARMLKSSGNECDPFLVEQDLSLANMIGHYDELEEPAKVANLLSIVGEIRRKGEKVVVWSNFIETLQMLLAKLSSAGHGAKLIYGATPIENATVTDELSREAIIREFTSVSSGVDVLVANPAACAESISLHKTCSNAIYYDLSYNCAQYLQSLDRIHRVGGSEHKSSQYYFLQYENTIDDDILKNVRQKADNMSRVIDREYPIVELNMFEEDEELEAYERLFGK